MISAAVSITWRFGRPFWDPGLRILIHKKWKACDEWLVWGSSVYRKSHGGCNSVCPDSENQEYRTLFRSPEHSMIFLGTWLKTPFRIVERCFVFYKYLIGSSWNVNAFLGIILSTYDFLISYLGFEADVICKN